MSKLQKIFVFTVIGTIFLAVSCSNTPINSQTPISSPLIAENNRESTSSLGIIEATLNDTVVTDDTEFLLTISNSSRESVKLVSSGNEQCFSETFWFYGQTIMGWQPKPPLLSFVCFPEQNTDYETTIGAGYEKELDVGFLLGSRGLWLENPSTYILKVKYLDSVDQEFFLYTNNFDVGSVPPRASTSINIENGETSTLGFNITNNSKQSIWLAPPCALVHLASGWIDQDSSSLQMMNQQLSWSIPYNKSDYCLVAAELIEIKSGETISINGAEWSYEKQYLLDSGSYRWDIVFYLNLTRTGVEDGRHIFSDVFDYQN